MSRSDLRTLALAAVLAGALAGSNPAAAAPDPHAAEEHSPRTWLERLTAWLDLPWWDWSSPASAFAGNGSDPSSGGTPPNDDGHVIDPNG